MDNNNNPNINNNINEQTTTEPVNTIEEEKKKLNTLYAVFAVILVIVIAAIVFFLLTDMNKSNGDNNSTPTNNKPNNEVTPPKEQVEVSLWNGAYVNGDKSIQIFKSDEDIVTINIVVGTQVATFDVEVDSTTKIEYEDDFFGEDSMVNIEKTSNGIKVNANSSETDNILNQINGEYSKNSFQSMGWDGTYTSDEGMVILSEVDQNYIKCVIYKGYSTILFTASEVSADKLYYNDRTDGETVEIVKTDNGIQVTASSNTQDSLFNEVSGIYKK